MRDEQWLRDNVNWITKEQTSRNNEIIKEVRTHQLKGNKAPSRTQYYDINVCWRCFVSSWRFTQPDERIERQS